ncbi:MAG: transketolase [Candidatus Omnitrophica bacterium]|nr:transketolase [Candidatus Omnitrophota bacterium]
MRAIFNKTLVELARKDSRIFMVLADIGYGEIEPFAKESPERYFNVGVAEQNMTGVACGIAMDGNIAITYSIANFPTLRCLEQIRNDVCYHNANVKIVIIGGGMAYGSLGVSHHSTEDIAIMRALPKMVVLAPSDLREAKAATEAMIEHNGPVYYRCGYKKEPDIHSGNINFKIGRAIPVQDGGDVTLIYTGTIGFNVMKAAELLKKHKISCRVISMHTVKPIDKDAILKSAKETGAIITVEEHNINGGLGGSVAEVLAEGCPDGVKFKMLGLPDLYVSKVGSQQWLLAQYNLNPEGICNSVMELVRRMVK